jgi:hypothetical protein
MSPIFSKPVPFRDSETCGKLRDLLTDSTRTQFEEEAPCEHECHPRDCGALNDRGRHGGDRIPPILRKEPSDRREGRRTPISKVFVGKTRNTEY